MVGPKRASFVGERGVELFTPGVTGAIVTNQRLMSFLGSMVQEPTVLQALNQLAGGGGVNYSGGAGGIVNISTTNVENYNLTVNSTQDSRGVIQDFYTMKSLRNLKV